MAGPGGATTDSVTAEGVRAAFAVGAIIALVTIPLVLMVRRATPAMPGPGADADHSAASTAENSSGSTTLAGAPTKNGATSSGS